MTPTKKVSILGTVGLPARYGGFETLAAALVLAADAEGKADALTVACSARTRGRDARPERWHGARLDHLPLRANGVQSIPYDIWSLLRAVRRRDDAILLLGVSGAIALPLIRLISRAKLVVHIDGIEWQRPKWRGAARWFLRLSETMAVRWAHEVIADNPEIARHVAARHGRVATEISYGSEQALATPPGDISDLTLPPRFALAIGRVEPENNLEMILTAFSDMPRQPLVVLGNWAASDYGRGLRARFADTAHLYLLDAEYDPARLRAIRDRASLFVHGHSAGGTNPSLVEMMPFAIPVAAFDCAFNRETTEGAAAYFSDAEGLQALIPVLSDPRLAHGMGAELAAMARRRYRWPDVTAAYFQLLGL